MKKEFICKNFPHILHGGDYNPDQWTDYPDVLDEDMRLMKLSGCNSMTVGIFAWAKLEPSEGVFDFSFLDKTFDDVYRNGGRIILATPSGARPAWLSQKYPEVLRTFSDRRTALHGKRHNHCYTSPIYREKTAIINEKLAERYGKHPALIMWHLSNEYGGECHCALCREAFRSWLKAKYGSLDNLNKQWWTSFWAHTYTDWSQIEPPSHIGEDCVHGLTLDWKRFVTHQTADFMRHEIESVKKYTPDIPVTTNLMGFYQGLDYREIAKYIDVVSWDNYPSWKGDDSDIAVASEIACVHDLNRSLKHKPFMMMESTPSCVNWKPFNKLKRPGQHMLSSVQAIAHGSDTVQYFQWRKSRGCSEKFHGAVVDHVGNENTRVFREVSELGKRLSKLDQIVGTQTVSKTAILYDWSNQWALDDANAFCKDNKKLLPTLNNFYRPLWKRGINTDIIGFEDDFDNYSLIIAPMVYMIDDKLEKKIAKFIENGGTFLATYVFGLVNENDLCHLGGTPCGSLKEVFGIICEETDTLYPDESNTVTMENRIFTAVDLCDLIHADSAKVLAHYSSDFYSGMPAFTVNSYGKGKAYYIAFRDRGDFTDLVVSRLLSECNITSDFDGELPYGMTAHSRTDGDSIYVFLENFSSSELSTSSKFNWTKVEDGSPVSGSKIVMKPYETLILKRQ